MEIAATRIIRPVKYSALRVSDRQRVDVHVVPITHMEYLGNVVWWHRPSVEEVQVVPDVHNFPFAFAAVDNSHFVRGYSVVRASLYPDYSHLYLEHYMSARFAVDFERIDVLAEVRGNQFARVGWALFARICRFYFELGGTVQNPDAIATLPIKQAREKMGRMGFDRICGIKHQWGNTGTFRLSGKEAQIVINAVENNEHLLL